MVGSGSSSHLEVHPLPVGLEEDAQLLGPAQREHRNQDLPAPVDAVVNLEDNPKKKVLCHYLVEIC